VNWVISHAPTTFLPSGQPLESESAHEPVASSDRKSAMPNKQEKDDEDEEYEVYEEYDESDDDDDEEEEEEQEEEVIKAKTSVEVAAAAALVAQETLHHFTVSG